MHAQITTPATRTGVPLMGSSATPLVTGDATGGAWEVMELVVGPGGRSPLHTIGADKVFLVLSGPMTITLGDDDHVLDAGAVVQVPGGTPHCYRNESDRDGRLVVITTGDGHVDFLLGMSRLTADGPPEPLALAEHTERYGVSLLAPAPTAVLPDAAS